MRSVARSDQRGERARALTRRIVMLYLAEDRRPGSSYFLELEYAKLRIKPETNKNKIKFQPYDKRGFWEINKAMSTAGGVDVRLVAPKNDL